MKIARMLHYQALKISENSFVNTLNGILSIDKVCVQTNLSLDSNFGLFRWSVYLLLIILCWLTTEL